MFDGVEFDIRLTADGQLIVHHDRTVSVPRNTSGSSEMDGGVGLDDLTGLGFLARCFLDDPAVLKAWRDEGSMGCIEIKRPHPNSAVGGGFLGRTPQQTHRQGHAVGDRSPQRARHSTRQHGVLRLSSWHARFCSSLQPTVLGRRSSLTSAYGNRTSQRLQVLPNFSPRPLPAWSNNTEHRGAPCCPAPLSTFNPRPSIFPSGDMSASKERSRALNRAREGNADLRLADQAAHRASIAASGHVGAHRPCRPITDLVALRPCPLVQARASTALGRRMVPFGTRHGIEPPDRCARTGINRPVMVQLRRCSPPHLGHRVDTTVEVEVKCGGHTRTILG